jgi:glycosyltransferase involved in cell wall biosynthesis
MTRVFVLCEYATLNGGERSMLATLDGVRRAGFEVAVVAPPEGPLAETLGARGVELLPFRFRDPSGRRRPLGRLREELARRLAERRPQLLHANSLSMGRLSGPVADELRLPSAAHLRDIVKLSRQAVTDLNRHARLIAVSEATRDFHAARGLAAAKMHVLHNGVDLRRFRPRRATGYLHRELGLPPDAPLVGTVGQICLRKGQDVLVRAAAQLAREKRLRGGIEAHYLIVGGRWSEKAESRRFHESLLAAASGPLAGRLHFVGFRHDVDRLLNELSLLVHPARQEPLGRVLIEAAASGTAVVATDVGGTREIFPPPCRAARLVPADDPRALASAVAEFLANPPLRASLAGAARRRAEQAFDADHVVPKLVEHYWQVLGG